MNEMNDFTKERLSLKLRNALDTEEISQKHATEILGLKSYTYLSSILSNRPEQWAKASKKSWEQVRRWANSGESLKNYSLLTEAEKGKFERKETEPHDEKVELEYFQNEATISAKGKLNISADGSSDPLDTFLSNMKKLGYKVEIKINN